MGAGVLPLRQRLSSGCVGGATNLHVRSKKKAILSCAALRDGSSSLYRERIMNREFTAQFIKMLTNLDQLLVKAAAHAESKKCDVNNFFGDRLIVDMLPLSKQVLICCESAKACVATASHSDNPSFADEPATMADLRGRIQATIDFLKGHLESDYSAFESGKYFPYWANGKWMDGKTCFYEYGLPNFYFHLTMTYALLRRAGVELGKGDYLGALAFHQPE